LATEFCQHIHVVPGVFDLSDVVTIVLCTALALILEALIKSSKGVTPT
jgi:hypothetical protein